MNKFNFSSQEDIIMTLSTLSDGEIANWINQIILGDSTVYPNYLRNDTQPADVINDIYNLAVSKEVKEKFISGIEKIVNQVDWSYDDIKYLESLLGVVARLRPTNILFRLKSLATREILKERKNFSGTPLHAFLLSAIISTGYDLQIEEILVRDIHDPYYAALAFRFIWSQNIKKAIEISYVIINHAVNQRLPHFPAKLLLQEFVDKNTLINTWLMFNEILKSEQTLDTARIYFLDLVYYCELNFCLIKNNADIIIERIDSDFDKQFIVPMDEIDWIIFQYLLDFFAIEILKFGPHKIPSEVEKALFYPKNLSFGLPTMAST